MTSNLPRMKYRVDNATGLEDLVVWSTQNFLGEFQTNKVLRLELHAFLQQRATTRYFAGPIDSQIEFDPIKEVPPAPLVLVHVQVATSGTDQAFLYLTTDSTELHLPERLGVTGDLNEDKHRRLLIRELVEGLGTSLLPIWELAEYGGCTCKFDKHDEFWLNYWEHVFGSIEYTQVNE